MTNSILLENLTKVYHSSKCALDNINLAIPKGSIFALLGPNGAGKSTLINILAGTVIKTSGKAYVNGIDIDINPQSAKYEIGIVPQEITIDTFFPVKKALEIYAGYYGIRPKDRKTDEILEALGLTDKANAMPRELSGGMKRRFLVAKSMVHSPGILVLDEPTAGVDIELRDQLWRYVRYLNSQGTTIILTTHYLAEAETLCDWVAFINHGKIVLIDKKVNLMQNLGTKQLILELTSEVSGTIALPKGVEFVSSINGKLILKFDDRTSNITEIISHLGKHGMDVKNLMIDQPDFEDIFKKVMAG
jgi:ABC-2 type transport system ATP-binding protein